MGTGNSTDTGMQSPTLLWERLIGGGGSQRANEAPTNLFLEHSFNQPEAWFASLYKWAGAQGGGHDLAVG